MIATADANIGMGGPAMIEGGGLGVYRPDDIGPIDVQGPNGVVDIEVADEVEAVAVAKQYLSYFQGPTDDWDCVDQRLLRSLIPENRVRVYDVRTVIDALADTGSVLELRQPLRRRDGHVAGPHRGSAVGIVANNPGPPRRRHRRRRRRQGGPLPPAVRRVRPAGPVPLRHARVHGRARRRGHRPGPPRVSGMFVAGAALTVPFMTIVLRKGYGLGAQAMAGGSFRAPLFTVAWPTGEIGGMGLEGAVRLGFRRELDAVEDPVERHETVRAPRRRRLRAGQGAQRRHRPRARRRHRPGRLPPPHRQHAAGRARRPPPRTGKKRPFVDTW